MKKHLSKRVVGSLGVVGVGIVIGAGQAEAQSITLSGTIAQSCNLTINSSGSYNNLSLTTAQSNVVVGTSGENCNDGKGYKVTIGTRNGTTSGLLKGTSYSQTLAYGVNYGSTATLTFAGSTATATNTSATGFTTYTVGVTYNAGTQLTADTYTDTLTFTMTTN
ncbi:MAG: hypothetical protein ACLQJR_35540 [Stellaceae bacterium]